MRRKWMCFFEEKYIYGALMAGEANAVLADLPPSVQPSADAAPGCRGNVAKRNSDFGDLARFTVNNLGELKASDFGD